MRAGRYAVPPCILRGMTHPHPVIGLSGAMRSGKDTAATTLLEQGFVRVSFADKLRAFMYALDPLIPTGAGPQRLAKLVDVHGWEACKNTYPEVRALLQRCGTDAGRKVLHENVWVDAVARTLPDEPIVVTDVRFPNEADALRAAGGVIVRVTRPGFTPGADAHPSETAMNGYLFDYEVKNDGTVRDLHNVLRVIAEATARTHELESS